MEKISYLNAYFLFCLFVVIGNMFSESFISFDSFNPWVVSYVITTVFFKAIKRCELLF